MSNEIKAKYASSQPELYAICNLGWNICKQHQIDVEGKFPEYTMLYIDDKLARIAVVEAQPDFQVRDSVTEKERNDLKKLAVDAIFNWKLLERYIIRAHQTNKEQIKPDLEAAGSGYYRTATATSPDWEDLKQMLISGKNFITNNILLLTGKMYVGFPADYDTTKNAFQDKYNQFTLGVAGAPNMTDEKIEDNNEIYDDLMLMLGDLKMIAPPATQDEVTFAYLKGIISSPGPAGLKGTVTGEATGNKLTGVLLRLLETDYEATTDGVGEYDFGNIASGTYTLEISKDGYQTLTVTVQIFTGVTSTKNYVLASST